MTTSSPRLDEHTNSSLARGDRAAAAAEWVSAVSNWETALSTPDRGRAEMRLQWFLASAALATTPQHHRRCLSVVLLGFGAASVGTGLLLIAQEIGNPWREAFVVTAWICFVVASACGVLFAYRQRPQPRPPLSTSSVVRARDLAEQMDSGSGTMPIGPRFPA